MNRKYKKVILDNGIKLYIHADKTMRKCFVSYTVQYGSSGNYFNFNYDSKDYSVLPGCAHYLEHMLLEQSRYGNLYVYFKSLKYNTNAYTSFERTKYFFSGTKNIKSSIKKMIYALEKPIFKDKEIEGSRPAIIEETKRGMDDHFFQALCLQTNNSYKNFNLVYDSLTSIGTEETTKKLDYNMLKLCYDAFYTDDRKIIVVTGNFDEEDMINYIKSIYSKIPKHENKTKLLITSDLSGIKKEYDVLVRKAVEDDILIMGYKDHIKGFSKFEKDMFLDFISLFKFSNKTAWYEKEKNKDVLVATYGYDSTFMLDEDYFNYCFIFVTRNKDVLIKDIDKEMKTNNFDKYEFDLFKKGLISDYLYSSIDKYLYYVKLSDNISFYKEEIVDYIDKVNSLTFDRFIEFYNSLSFENRVITLLTKEG